ncbi:hypothetical protein Acsp02_97590 [Actinoplanes sp. NBRC 103695]|nr:hypothetical protein Acsp02_97590 [Actinoplanes sp. NBRC 103695]
MIIHNLTRAADAYRTVRPQPSTPGQSTSPQVSAHRACKIHLHLPERWSWQAGFDNLLPAAVSSPRFGGASQT